METGCNNVFKYNNETFEAHNHMAILRNLRNIATYCDFEHVKKILLALKCGVKEGKQFPYRYWSAIDAVKASECHHKPVIIDALEECMDIALENMPKLKGKTMCLSDNSGSAWGGITSEYGTVKIAEIDNLSSVITAACSDEGYVGKFGDELKVFPIAKRKGVLSQTEEITKDHDRDVGGSTEGGIWKFFKQAVDNKEHWDNIFIYSDQQAGHGGLYGTASDIADYRKLGFEVKGGYYTSYCNVFKLIQEYRKKVNPKVNVFSVQTASYTTALIPELQERSAILYGWTGKEAIFADAYIRIWDDISSRSNKILI